MPFDDHELDTMSTMSDLILAVTEAAREGVVSREVASEHVAMYLSETMRVIEGSRPVERGTLDGSEKTG